MFRSDRDDWVQSMAMAGLGFTFLPEFLPGLIQRLFRPIERRLESSSWRKYSAHYMAALERT